MKNQITSAKSLKRFAFVFMTAISFYSCGTYQNSTYQENDGIYASNEKESEQPTASSTSNASGTAYKSYFRTLRNDLDQELITDVEEIEVQNDSIDNSKQQYGGWGSDNSTVVVNVYDNGWNNWGWNNWYGPGWGFGWNNWYGPNWGFGWGVGYGWGWNNWYGPGWGGGWYNQGWYGGGYYNGWYGNGYRNTYVRNSGRRGVYGNTGGRYSIGNRNSYASGRNSSASGRNSTYNGRNSTRSN